MTPPWFLERMTAADWAALGISNHRQLVLTDEQKLREVGTDAVIEHKFGHLGWSDARLDLRSQMISWLVDCEWERKTAPARTQSTACAPDLATT